MLNLIRDARFALRLGAHNKFAIGLVLLIFSVGLAPSISVFVMLRAVAVRSVPYPAPDELVSVSGGVTPLGRRALQGSHYEAIAARQSSFSVVASCDQAMLAVRGNEAAERASVGYVTAQFFSAFRLAAQLGRVLGPDEGIAEQGAVISDSLWSSQFGRSPDVIGQKLRIADSVLVVQGVTPPEFAAACGGSRSTPSLWILRRANLVPASAYVSVVGRLRSGTTVQHANAELAVILSGVGGERKTTSIEPLVERLGTEASQRAMPGLLWMQGAALLLLLVMVSNLANIILLHLSSRDREFVVRKALGCSGRQLCGQVLTEITLFAALGTGTSLFIARLSMPMLLHLAGDSFPREIVPSFGLWETMAGFGVAWLALVLFAAVPAWIAVRRERAIQVESSAVTTTRPARALRETLVAFGVAVTIVISLAVGLLLRSAWQLTQVPLGFDSDGLVVADVSLPVDTRSAQRSAFASAFTDAARRQLAPSDVAFGNMMPFSSNSFTTNWEVGMPDGEVRAVFGNFSSASENFFDVLGIPILAGAWGPSLSTQTTNRIAVVNEAFLQKVGTSSELIGATVKSGPLAPFTIVGVVGDTENIQVGRRKTPVVYVQHGQIADFLVVVAVRHRPIIAVREALKRALADVDPAVPVVSVVSVREEILAREQSRVFFLGVLGVLGVVAILLAVAGIAGVVTYSGQLRRREFAVRSALGATPGQLAKLAMVVGIRPVVLGIGIGLTVGYQLAALIPRNKAFTDQLFKVQPHDTMTFGAAGVAFLMIGIIACVVSASAISRSANPRSLM